VLRSTSAVRTGLFGLLLVATLLGQGWACRDQGSQRAEEEVSQTPMTIQEAKEAWEAKLMAIPGVSGVAIGLTKDRKEKCIKVYVATDTAADTIPRAIEGFPVEIESRGAFRAQ
jgi:hypothetical protein